MARIPGEDAVSEIIGVMLLVGVTVLAVALVAAILLSSPQPDEIPHATIVAGNESGRLVLAHDGGDPLREGEYRVYIETESGLVERTRDFTGSEDGVWSIGGRLVYEGTERPGRVVVTAVSGSSETILAEPAFVSGGAGFSPDPVEPGAVSNGGESGSEETPIVIVFPEEGTEMSFTKVEGDYCSPISANATDANITRVDFLLYDYSPSTNFAIDHKKNVTWIPENGAYEAEFEVKSGNGNGHIGTTTSVVVVAIAFNETDIVGCDARKVYISVN